MADLTYTPTTSGSDLSKVWKKIQGPLVVGFNATCEEYGWLKALRNAKIVHSVREVTFPVDITPEVSVASIAEGGKEARPITTAPQEATLTWINYNARFTRSLLAKYLDARAGAAEVEDQMKYQGRKLMEALVNTVGRDFYGLSTAVMCKTSTNATQSSGTYTLIDAYGQAGLDTAAFLAGLFQINDRVALVRSAALVTNGIGTVTAKSAANGTIDITWLGSVDSDANDEIVFANSIENTTLAGTAYNRGLVGLIDGITSTSVHSLSGSTYPKWIGASNSAGGRFDLGGLQDHLGDRARVTAVPVLATGQ